MAKQTEIAFQTGPAQPTGLETAHLNLIRKTAKKILWKYSNREVDIEEAVQNVFLGVLNHLIKNNGNEIKNLMGYVRTVTLHESIKIARENDNRQKKELSLDEEGLGLALVEEIASHPEKTEIKMMYQQSIQSLSTNQRDIVELLTIGMKCNEIAEVMDVKATKIRQEIYRIRRSMSAFRNYLKREYKDNTEEIANGENESKAGLGGAKEIK